MKDDTMRDAVIVAAARSPIGRARKGSLASVRPGGEQGYNMGRVVAVTLGLDRVPAATVTRYCASSVQTTRMAFHAVRAGEGDVFVSAGVECVSRG